ncbi:MAG: hypothetical protein Q8K59_09830 [Nitrosomonas sp.]|nr:hypothetical protein [Nitrosomonas sp.]
MKVITPAGLLGTRINEKTALKQWRKKYRCITWLLQQKNRFSQAGCFLWCHRA